MRKICTGMRKKGGTKYAVCYMCKIMCTNNTKCKLVPCVAALQPLVCVSVCMCVWMGEIETVKHFVELVKVKKALCLSLEIQLCLCVWSRPFTMNVCVCVLLCRLYAGREAEWSLSAPGWSEQWVCYGIRAAGSSGRMPLWCMSC